MKVLVDWASEKVSSFWFCHSKACYVRLPLKPPRSLLRGWTRYTSWKSLLFSRWKFFHRKRKVSIPKEPCRVFIVQNFRFFKLPHIFRWARFRISFQMVSHESIIFGSSRSCAKLEYFEGLFSHTRKLINIWQGSWVEVGLVVPLYTGRVRLLYGLKISNDDSSTMIRELTLSLRIRNIWGQITEAESLTYFCILCAFSTFGETVVFVPKTQNFDS